MNKQTKIRPCKRCKEPVYFEPDGRGWIAKDPSGVTHKCATQEVKGSHE